MSRPAASAGPVPAPMTRDKLDALLAGLLRGPGAARARRIILSGADLYAAHLVEQCARPDDRWGPA